MSRAPAFQFYPDKALAGTSHLSGAAFRAYWKILWWMWLHSDTQYSMKNSDNAWSIACGFRGNKLKKIRREIMQDEFPLFRLENNFLISNGLRKEWKKQETRRIAAKTAAEKRWANDADASSTHSDRIPDASSTQCTLSLSPSVSPSVSSTTLREGDLTGKEPVKSLFAADGIERELSMFLHDRIREHLPKARITDAALQRGWPKVVDLMIRIDRRTPDEIRCVIDWAQSNSFWKTNILSMEKLRKQFDALTARMNEEGFRPSSNNGTPPAPVEEELFDEWGYRVRRLPDGGIERIYGEEA